MAQLKRAEGIHVSHKKKFAKKGGDVNDFMSQLFKKFVADRMDSMSHCDVNAIGTSSILGSAAATTKMMSVLEHCVLFNLTDMRTENKESFPSTTSMMSKTTRKPRSVC